MNGERWPVGPLARARSRISGDSLFGHAALLRVTLALVMAALAAGAALAQAGSSVDRWVVAGGGGPSSAGTILVNDTLGQPIAGPSSSETVALGAGYWYGAPEPTGVEIGSFTAETHDGGILLRWETATEVNVLGFNLYRADRPDGGKRLLNESLIPAQEPGSPGGAAYEWSDEDGLTGGQVYYYWLEAIDVQGHGGLFGPVDAMARMWRVYLPLAANRLSNVD